MDLTLVLVLAVMAIVSALLALIPLAGLIYGTKKYIETEKRSYLLLTGVCLVILLI